MQLFCKDNNLVIKTTKTNIILDDKICIGEIDILGAGEFEVSGVFVYGLSKKLYSFRAEAMLIVYFEPNQEDIDKNLDGLSDTEVLILKNGKGDISKEVSQTLSRLEPKIVVPLGFADTSILTKSEGQVIEEATYKITKTDLPEEGRKILVLPCSKKL